MTSKKTVVAGGTGNIGGRIIKTLLNKDIEVRFEFQIYVCNSTKCEHSFFFN